MAGGTKITTTLRKKKKKIPSVFWKQHFCRLLFCFMALMVSIEKWFLFYMRMFFSVIHRTRGCLSCSPESLRGITDYFYQTVNNTRCHSACIPFKVSHSTPPAVFRMSAYNRTNIVYSRSCPSLIVAVYSSSNRAAVARGRHQPRQVLYISEVLLQFFSLIREALCCFLWSQGVLSSCSFCLCMNPVHKRTSQPEQSLQCST